MGLIHWWPLIGDDVSDKIGNDSFKLTKYNTKSATNILGTGFAFGTSSNSRLEIPVAAAKDLKGAFSISFWMRLNSWNTSYSTPLGLYKNDVSWAGNIVSFLRNGSASTIAFCISDGTTATQENCISSALSTGVWYRVTGVYSPGSIKLYIDSILQKTYSTTIVPNTNTVTFANIGAASSGSYQTDSSIQDVRFYDHALSLKEITELSKGKIVHYSFNDPLVEGTTNYSKVDEWGIYPTYWTLVEKTSSGFKITKTPNNTETTVALDNGTIYGQMGVGDIWTSSCYLYKNNKPYKTTVNCLTNYGLGVTVLEWESREDGYYRSTFKINSKSNAYLIHTRIFGDTVSTSDTYEIRSLQFEKRDHATPYTSGTRNAKSIVNETGSNNLSSVQNLSLTSDSAIGPYALVCNGNTYVSGDLVGDTTKGATASLWVKAPTYPTANSIVFADNNSKLAFGFYGTTDAIISCGSMYSGVASNIKNSWKSGWNHICITKNASGTVACWLNGTKYTLSETTNHWTTNGKFVIGGRYNSGYNTLFTGYISDFRLYHTCLSDDDIKKIYNSRLSVAPSYTAVATAPISDGYALFNPTTSKTEVSNLIEPARMKLSDGSEWICIFNHDLRDDQIWFANATEAGICTNGENRYSLLNYIGQFKSTNNEYEFLLAYPEKGMISDGFYNRWRQQSDPNTTAASTVVGFVSVSAKWTSYNKGIAKSASTCYMNTNGGASSWYGALGQYAIWTTGKVIPAADGSSVSATQLWIRTDNTAYKGYFKTYDNGAMLISNLEEV